MAITEPDLQYFHAEEVSSASTNGGLMSQTEIVSGQKNNLWTNVSSADRTSGREDKRKVFGSPQSDTDDELVDPRIWNHGPTPGDDYVLMYAGTKTDTQATASEARAYGSGILANDISIGVSTLVVTVENAAMTGIFADADKIRLSNQSSPELTGDFELVDLSGAPAVVGLDITLTLATATQTAYLAANTVVSSLYEPGSTASAIGTVVVNSASGTVDEVGFAPTLNNRGTIDEELTFSFSDSTNFTVVGSRSGALASGITTADYTAVNPDNSKNIITLPSGFFGGSFVALDTVVIPTIANNFAFWLKRVVPAGAGTLNGDLNISAYSGES